MPYLASNQWTCSVCHHGYGKNFKKAATCEKQTVEFAYQKSDVVLATVANKTPTNFFDLPPRDTVVRCRVIRPFIHSNRCGGTTVHLKTYSLAVLDEPGRIIIRFEGQVTANEAVFNRQCSHCHQQLPPSLALNSRY